MIEMAICRLDQVSTAKPRTLPAPDHGTAVSDGEALMHLALARSLTSYLHSITRLHNLWSPCLGILWNLDKALAAVS